MKRLAVSIALLLAIGATAGRALSGCSDSSNSTMTCTDSGPDGAQQCVTTPTGGGGGGW
jgi:hypothetical protein